MGHGKFFFGFLTHFGPRSRRAELRLNIPTAESCFMNRPNTTGLLLLIGLLQGCGPQAATVPNPPVADSKPSEDSPSFFEGRDVNEKKFNGDQDVTEKADADLMDLEERYKSLVNRVKPGMSKEQVEAILGMADESDEKDMGELNPQKAGQILDICTWHGDTESQSSIILSFVNGQLQDGGTPGYDIRKGFSTQLPSNMTPEEEANVRKAAKGLGINTEDE